MEMLKRSKNFRVQILCVVSQLSQRGVDPCKHARSRPMRLNVRRPLRHGGRLVRLNEANIVMSERQSAIQAAKFSLRGRASGCDQLAIKFPKFSFGKKADANRSFRSALTSRWSTVSGAGGELSDPNQQYD